MKRVLTTILILTLAIVVSAQVSVEAMIDSIQIPIGEQTGLHVSATIKRGQKIQFMQYKPLQEIISGVEVVEAPKVDTIEESNDFIKVTQHLILTSFEDTLYAIPPQKIIVDGKDYMTKTLALKVLDVEVDTVHTNQYFGPKDVQDNPFLWEEWEWILLMSVLATLLYLLCWMAYLRLKSNKPIRLKVRIIKKIPPHQRALTAIEQLKQEYSKRGTDIWNSPGEDVESKAYYTQLTDTLRKYMEERFGFNAMEMTSSEIIERLQQEQDQEKIQELRMLFETADLVKFAKMKVDAFEKDRNLGSAVEFINVTKQDNLPTEERIMPTVTEQERQTMRMRLSLKWAIVALVTSATALVSYVVWMLWEM